MKKEDIFIRDLMKELPQEKAPIGITELIMSKIEKEQAAFPKIKVLRVWQMQSFYIMIAIVAVESWLLYSVRDWFTLANAESVIKKAYVAVIEYFAVPDFSAIFTVLAIIGVLIYLFVKDRIERAKYYLCI